VMLTINTLNERSKTTAPFKKTPVFVAFQTAVKVGLISVWI